MMECSEYKSKLVKQRLCPVYLIMILTLSVFLLGNTVYSCCNDYPADILHLLKLNTQTLSKLEVVQEHQDENRPNFETKRTRYLLYHVAKVHTILLNFIFRKVTFKLLLALSKSTVYLIIPLLDYSVVQSANNTVNQQY